MGEKFRSSTFFLYVEFGAIITLFILGYFERGLPDIRILMIIGFICLILTLESLWSFKTTHLHLTQQTLTNSGYHSFRKDTIAISKIKYITRIPQTALPFVGPSLMLIYSTRDDGVIAHAAVREYSYNETVLKQFLTRIKELNPTIELDSEYQEFLQDKRTLKQKTSNTVKTVEQMLRDKGEWW